MTSIGFVMRLRAGCYDEYKQRHDSLWPELSQLLSGAGVSMVIYRCDNYLFVHKVAETESRFAEVDEHPLALRWSQEMAKFLETDAAGNVSYQVLPLTFAFGIFTP